MSVDLTIDRDQITAADSVTLTLAAAAPEGQRLVFPKAADKLGKFTVANFRESEPRLVEGNRVRVEHIYELEPFLPGDYEIPPLAIEFGQDGRIETEAVTVHVVSVLPKDAGNPEIKEIAPPVALPGLSPWIYAGGAAVLLAIGLLIWWRLRKRTPHAEPEPLPHEVAMRAMRELMAEDLIAKGQAKLFHLRLSAILRHYLEDRFGLHAPERTTEEFLHDLRRDNTLGDSHKPLLERFLVHCDMVKFAEYEPSREEIENTINTCAQFIAETKPSDQPVPVPQPAGSSR